MKTIPKSPLPLEEGRCEGFLAGADLDISLHPGVKGIDFTAFGMHVLGS